MFYLVLHYFIQAACSLHGSLVVYTKCVLYSVFALKKH